jgi:hypothetical protein
MMRGLRVSELFIPADHPWRFDMDAFARLLLSRGRNPNDFEMTIGDPPVTVSFTPDGVPYEVPAIEHDGEAKDEC